MREGGGGGGGEEGVANVWKTHSGFLIVMGGGVGRKKEKLTREDAQHYSGLLNAIPDISIRPWMPNYQIHFRTRKHFSYSYIYKCVYIYIYRERERCCAIVFFVFFR